MKTDKHLYDGIGVFYRFLRWLLARRKIKLAKKLKAKLCEVEPQHRDIPRYLDIIKAIRFWENSKDW